VIDSVGSDSSSRRARSSFFGLAIGESDDTKRVYYISYTRLRRLSPKRRETSPVAPEIVVEILSPDDRLNDVDEKRRVHFALKA
jgi:Uma2 family endonuclease